ncbi:MAG: hypothetical protein M1835_000599 [Candelina submexicana]|nr:MAG: hypothetical protein M1835_000599 [Candelina submexicana]
MSPSCESPTASQHGNVITYSSGASTRPTNGYAATRPAVLSVAKLLMVGAVNLPLLRAAPLARSPMFFAYEDAPKSSKDPTLWVYLGVAACLVLLGGAFAGLTIALMGQDEIYLQVLHTSGDGSERKHSGKVLRLLKRGKHWVLVTLLLGNVITNETLPIVLDRSLGGGWPAVLGSTALIVIFGEIIPQSVCVRYGLPIGAWMSPLVVILMWILAPVAWPTAKLLDRILGEDHGTTYKKAGLKSLVTLHKTLGSTPGERLNEDEVTIISAVLDLKDKPVGSIMTAMDDVFTMSADTILDEKTVDIILSAGYSRIPIYAPDNPSNFIGMLLVKILITYDPEDAQRVSDFALATLPETRAETSCLDIVNFFQEGKSHMVLVSEFPGENHGAIGVVTLEDVIEELIGEEIIDETDVSEVSPEAAKRFRRLARPQRSRAAKGNIVKDPDTNQGTAEEENLIEIDEDQAKAENAKHQVETQDGTIDAKDVSDIKPRASVTEFGSPKASFMPLRRSSSAAGSHAQSTHNRRNGPDGRQHLGPSNLASRPKTTRYNTVKIKTYSDTSKTAPKQDQHKSRTESVSSSKLHAPQGGVGEGLLNSAGQDAKDGVHAVQAGYGSMDRTPSRSSRSQSANKGIQATPEVVEFTAEGRPKNERKESAGSESTLGSLHSRNGGSRPPTARKNRVVRSGSITETHVDAGGVKKMVIETTSSSDSAEEGAKEGEGSKEAEGKADEDESKGNGEGEAERGKKKKRRRKRSGKVNGKGKDGEEEPLLDKRDE